ncbi:MAG: DUF2207 domain-containing protein [Lactobacillales bacterium]|jgi:hypothetical protein|nr:DUF2207 domain-containing protein [Lactobacillales bacterium]
MKKIILYAFTLSMLFMITGAYAQQQPDEKGLLDITKAPSYNSEDSVVYKGNPFVFIDGFSSTGPAKPAEYMDAEKRRLFGSTDILKEKTPAPGFANTDFTPYRPSVSQSQITFDVLPAFGPKTSADYIPHITDYTVIIQILNTEDVLVKENIQFIETSANKIFERTLPLTIDGRAIEINVLNVLRNKLPAELVHDRVHGNLVLQDSHALSQGLHSYEISYLVKNAISIPKTGGMAEFSISLTGPALDMGIERFSGIVLFPAETPIYKKELLFGSNKMAVPETSHIYSDEKGNIFFTLNHPLPAFADVKLVLDFDKKILMPPTLEEKIISHLDLYWFGLFILFLTLYMIIYLLYFNKLKKKFHSLLDVTKKTPLTIFNVAHTRLDPTFLNKEILFNRETKRRGLRVRMSAWLYAKSPLLANLTNRILFHSKIMFPYVAAVVVYVVFAFVINDYYMIGYSAWMAAGIIIYAFIMLVIIEKFGVMADERKQIRLFKEALMNKNVGFKMDNASLEKLYLRFYPYALATDLEMPWNNKMKEALPTLTKYSFFK